ncbi:MAG: hypothetical protein PHR64_03655, partial [Candidatus Shapirobacteria bacterium]|nr:hypothetical protein [Candidatus Shapirobacteria bacterium]
RRRKRFATPILFFGRGGRGVWGEFRPALSFPLSLFSLALEVVFCFAKCAARKDVALAPPNPCAGNDKELPFVFTNVNKFDNIVIN